MHRNMQQSSWAEAWLAGQSADVQELAWRLVAARGGSLPRTLAGRGNHLAELRARWFRVHPKCTPLQHREHRSEPYLAYTSSLRPVLLCSDRAARRRRWQNRTGASRYSSLFADSGSPSLNRSATGPDLDEGVPDFRRECVPQHPVDIARVALQHRGHRSTSMPPPDKLQPALAPDPYPLGVEPAR